MEKNVKGIIAVAVIGVLGYLGYKYFIKKIILGAAQSITDDNFGLLQKQLPAKADKNGVVSVPFNNNKNKAQFYSNNRVIIFDTTKTPPVRVNSGTYSQGGYNIVLDNGKDLMNTSSVWAVLNDIIK